MALSATLAGSVLLSGLTFTGAIDLTNAKNKAMDWASKVTQAVDGSHSMLDKFNSFKTDAMSQLNAKIAKINSLNAKIADLVSKVGSGQADLSSANDEISRLNTELDKANTEVHQLATDLGMTDQDVQAKFATLQTANNMDTSMNLDTQNPDTDTTTADATTTGSTTTTTTTPATPDYSAQQTAIANAITANYSSLSDIQVTITDTTVTLHSANLASRTATDFTSIINANLTGKTVSNWSGEGSATITYTLQ